MDDIIKVVGGAVVVAGLFFIFPLIGVVVGAFAGWVVGLLFHDVIIGFLARVGVDTVGLDVWQVGAALGFLGSFFKTTNTSSSK